MMHEQSLGVEFFTMLAEIDEEIAVGVAAAGCPVCGGPLHRGNYLRKPRGGWIVADEVGAPSGGGDPFGFSGGGCTGRESCCSPPSGCS